MLDIDLTNLDLFEKGMAETALATLRQEAPLYWNATSAGEGFWVLTRYKDILWAWKQPKILSSEYGNMLRLRGYKDPAAGKMMVVTDPPRHTRLRTLLNHGFTPQAVANMEPQVRNFACQLLDQLVPDQPFDFVTEVAAKLPVSVTCSLLGVPEADWKYVADLSTSSFAAEDSEFWQGVSVEQTLTKSNLGILSYFLDLIATRRQQPREDLVSAMIELRVNGTQLSSDEIALNCFSFLLGGNETTRYAAAAGLLALTQRPAELARLKEDLSLITTTVEEMLRWATPNLHVLRVATQDIHLYERTIHAGERVTLWSISANRDEAVFHNPCEFDAARTPNRHLTFGIGNHYCIGANIARLELKVLFLEILRRGYCFDLVSEPARLRSNFLSGFKHLYMRLRG
ncbi:MAG TPA: cytochrome P450 [Ktedonobacteraceae bacterium]|nr:cytochrome P450 [Ktedonobacteraceae bacterium]